MKAVSEQNHRSTVDSPWADKTAADKTAADKTAADKTAAEQTADHETADHRTADDKTAATAPPELRAEPGAGTLLAGRYRVVRKVGQGAMGSVYSALDEARSGLPVAVKLLREQRPGTLYRLKNEFRALSETRHPNLLGLHGLGVDERGWFVVMDLVEPSCDFCSYVRSAEFLDCDERKLRAALSQLVRGVGAMHRAGLLHRDLKPGNVLVTPEGRVVVADYGLVRDQSVEGGGTLDGVFAGTPAYAAPEQVRHEQLGPKADMYAVGVMLFEALSGRHPIEGASSEQLLQLKLASAAPDVRSVAPTVAEDLRSLCNSLLQRDPGLRPDAEQVLRLLDEAHPMPPEPQRLPFVAREAELAALSEAARRTRSGQPVIATIRGASGIGKSALLGQFVERIRSDAQAFVLRGRCHQQEQVPYKAFDTLIDDLVRHLMRLSALDAARLMPRDVGLLSRLFPTLARVAAVQNMPHGLRGETDEALLRRLAFGALKELLARIGDQALLVLCFDDVQWSDADSAELLRELLREPRAPACLVVCGTRDEPTDGAFVTALHSLSAIPQSELRLGPLEPLAAAQLARAVLCADLTQRDVDLVVAESAGSPFLVLELARAAREHGSVVRVQEVVTQRIGRLELHARHLLELVSTAGRPLALSLALEAVESPLQALAAALASGLLRITTKHGVEQLESSHDKVREAVVAGIGAPRSRELHTRLGRALGRDAGQDPELIAQHYRAAGLTREAAPYTIAAAERACRVFAFGRAVALYEQALDEAPEARQQALRTKLAEAYANNGNVAAAAECYELSAVRAVPASTARELLRKAMLMYLLAGDTVHGTRLCDALCLQLGVLPLPRQRVLVRLLQLWLIVRYLLGGSIRKLRVPLRERHDEASRERLALCSLAWRGFAHASPGHAFYFCLLALLGTRRHRDLGHWGEAISLEVAWRCIAAGSTSARDQRDAERAVALTSAHGDEETLAMVLSTNAACSVLTGHLARGAEEMERAEQVLSARGRSVTQVFNGTRTGRLVAWTWLGRFSELEAHVDGWIAEALAVGDRNGALLLERMSAYRHLARDDPRAARAARTIAGLHTDGLAAANPWWLADIALYEGDALAAREAYRAAVRSREFRGVQAGAAHRAWTALTLGRIELALAAEKQPAARPRQLRRAMARLRRERHGFAAPGLAQLEAGLALAHGDRARAALALERAASGYVACACFVHAAAAQYAQGVLTPGEAGTQLAAVAMAQGRDMGIVNPRRWFLSMVTGLGLPT